MWNEKCLMWLSLWSVLVAGVELAASCGRAQGERGAALMLITAATGMALGSTAIGFLAGAYSQ